MSGLFEAFALGPLRLRTRLVMAPMSRAFCPEGVPTAAVAEYYARRARNHVGLTISEGAYIDHPAAACYPDCPNFFGERALAGWRGVIDAVHAAGGAMFPQLWHVGSHRRRGLPPNPALPGIAPSSYVNPLSGESEVARAMSERDVAEVIDSFVRAAVNAQQLGFDGVEIQGSQGYLVDEFLWSKTNLRADRYGGAIGSRARFAAEIIAAIRRSVGPDFPIAFRFSQHKQQDYDAIVATDPGELEQLITPLVDAGVSLFDVVARHYWQTAFTGSPLTLAGWFRKLSGKPAIAIGGVGLDTAGQRDGAIASLDQLTELLARDEFDLIAVGRALLADAEWGTKVLEGRLDERRAYRTDMRRTLD